MQRKMFRCYFILFCVLNIVSKKANCQVDTIKFEITSDTTRKIEIIQAKDLRQITLGDGKVIETLAGNAIVKQGKTILSGDSIVLNKLLGIAEVFGHVHINDADTVNTYSDYLKYMGNEQVAYLKKSVKLTDGKVTLTTNDLIYDLRTGIATYQNGGKVKNQNTTLTSESAIYYSDTKDVFFKNNVHLKDPKYEMNADSLRYNTAFKNAYFISPTHIISEQSTIDTRSGSYNLETGEAVFNEKTIFKDKSRYMSGNKVAFEEKTNTIQIEGNGKLVDSTNQVMVLGDKIFIDKKNGSFLATRKPIMIFYKNQDSTFITADTLFSNKRIMTASEIALNRKKAGITDSLKLNAPPGKTDSIRYFRAYQNVKIFNDSLQSVCGNLIFSTEDSVFKLYQKPYCWNGNTQLSGDTILLFTTNQQPQRLFVYNNAMVINKTEEGFYNQMVGKTMNGSFLDGNIDYIRTKGIPAESIFYPQGEDSAYTGMNRSSCDVIDIFFSNKNINKIKFVNQVKGILYPMNQIPENLKLLKGFIWNESFRPKSKFAIFE
jgi:lipopolysaccharide export system protein LptA